MGHRGTGLRRAFDDIPVDRFNCVRTRRLTAAARPRIDEHIAPKVMEPFLDRAEKKAEQEADKKAEQADGS